MTFADPCTGARTTEYRSGADSPRGLDHGQSDGARVPPRWSGHRGRLVAPDELARSCKATPLWAVARRSRYVPLRFTSRDLRRASQEPHERGTGGRWSDGRREGLARPLTDLRGPVPRAGTEQPARPARDARPFGEGAAPPGAPRANPVTFCPVLGPEGFGPDLRPHPPARSACQTPHEDGWQRNVVASRNIICRKKVKICERHYGIECLACLKGT